MGNNHNRSTVQTLQNYAAKQQLKWSARLKHSQAEINGSVLSLTGDGRNGFGYDPICSLTNSLTEATNKGRYKWTVRINALKLGVYIGICQIRHAQSHKFEYWGWGNIGHGHYCLCQDGYVFSHSDANINFKQKSFKFKTGDVFYFEYDSIIGKMTVTKNNSEQYEMDIEKNTAEKYAVCAYLYKTGDSVQLMN